MRDNPNDEPSFSLEYFQEPESYRTNNMFDKLGSRLLRNRREQRTAAKASQAQNTSPSTVMDLTRIPLSSNVSSTPSTVLEHTNSDVSPESPSNDPTPQHAQDHDMTIATSHTIVDDNSFVSNGEDLLAMSNENLVLIDLEKEETKNLEVSG
ncbi:Uncharacterized protein Fot_06379 [Forsythia ovata]|uniref:Uncharacterized protein n=1 Tax=Forsythia ovata TaxID=205694 RepID=A0ABD1WTH3_9LAMI